MGHWAAGLQKKGVGLVQPLLDRGTASVQELPLVEGGKEGGREGQ